jgi:hypothetical protein
LLYTLQCIKGNVLVYILRPSKIIYLVSKILTDLKRFIRQKNVTGAEKQIIFILQNCLFILLEHTVFIFRVMYILASFSFGLIKLVSRELIHRQPSSGFFGQFGKQIRP